MTDTCGIRTRLDHPRCGQRAPYVAAYVCDADCCTADGHIALCDTHAAEVRRNEYSVRCMRCRHAGRPGAAHLVRITRTY